MNDHNPSSESMAFPAWFRWVMLGGATLILCSCSAPSQRMRAGGPPPHMVGGPPMLQTPNGPIPAPPLPQYQPLQGQMPGQMPGQRYSQQQGPQAMLLGAGAPSPVMPVSFEMDGGPVVSEVSHGFSSSPTDGAPVPCGPSCLPAPGVSQGACPSTCGGPCFPPTCETAWPPDEYIYDGGDRALSVQVGNDWSVRGLDVEDTVAHYDSACGELIVTPSNCVPIYAPRFAAVRVVTVANQDLQVVAPRGEHLALPPLNIAEKLQPAAATEHLQLGRQIGTRKAHAFADKQFGGAVSGTLTAREFSDRWKAYENLDVMKYGIVQQEQKVRLAKGMDAALVWSNEQAVQIVIDGQTAGALDKLEKPQMTYTIDAPCKPRLRVIKVASSQFAEPGDILEFTIRFDNIGTQAIGNVTLMDNLTTRLEYIEGSAQASVKSDEYERDEQGNVITEEREVERVDDSGRISRSKVTVPVRALNPVAFSTQPNEADSLVLRWELRDPLQAGQGGVLRFKCRVR